MGRSKSVFFAVLAVLTLFACKPVEPEKAGRHSLPPGVAVMEEDNGLVTHRSLAFHFQDLFNPRLAQFKIREPIEDAVSSGATEIERMRLLRDWASNQWEPSSPDPYPPWDAVTILEEIRAGRTGGFCAQYAVVLAQASLALGWQARYLAIAREEMPDNGHMTVEIWSNDFNKWVVMDPYFCLDYEKDGVPLGALEVHNALVNREDALLKLNFGKDLRANSPGKKICREELIAYYFHLAAELRNDHLSRPFNFWNRHQEYMSFEDLHTNGRPEIFSIFSTEEKDFNFPVNQVEVILSPGGKAGQVVCHLRTNMPNIKNIQIKTGDREWTPAPSRLDLNRLYGSMPTYRWDIMPGRNSLMARAVNEMGVKGPVSELIIEYKPRTR